MKLKSIGAYVVCLFLAFMMGHSFASAQTNFVNWCVFDMGSGVPASATMKVKSAVGQSFIGTTVHASNRIESGFLADTLLRGPAVSVRKDGKIPTSFALHQNYPNPFNPSTTVLYDLPLMSRVSIKLYNILGQEVATLVDEVQEAGYHRLVFDASALASGAYFYRIVADRFVNVKRMMILK
jgi:hypothetical protein